MSNRGTETDSKKVAAIVTWPRPTVVMDVWSFLGLPNHYRRFIHRQAQITHPLNALKVEGMQTRRKKKQNGTRNVRKHSLN